MAVTVLVNRIEESFTLQTRKFKTRIHFANYIMKNRRKIKGEQNLQYNLTIWNKNDDFEGGGGGGRRREALWQKFSLGGNGSTVGVTPDNAWWGYGIPAT